VKQPESGARDPVAAPAGLLDGIRLEQFLALQHAVLGTAADPDRLPGELAQRIALFLGWPAALGVIEDGRYRLLAAHGLGLDYADRYDGRTAASSAFDRALASGAPLVVREPAGPGPTLLLPFGTPTGGVAGEPCGALHLVMPAEAPVADDQLALARALAALAGLALAHARQERRLASVSRVKGDALNAMAHDLRAPLNALVGYASLLGEGAFGPLTDEQREIVATLERQAVEMVDLVGATLDVARLEMGRLPVRSESFALADVTGALAAGTFARPTRDGVLAWRIPGDLPSLRTDRVKVKEIVQNLVDNALKHRGDGTVEVSAALADSGDAVRITVRDHGPGIAPALLPQLFEPFRGDDARGTGFGLYIVRRFAEALGGRVGAGPAPGGGTVATVELPLVVPGR